MTLESVLVAVSTHLEMQHPKLKIAYNTLWAASSVHTAAVINANNMIARMLHQDRVFKHVKHIILIVNLTE